MEYILETQQLSKRYGRIQAVRHLDLRISPGQVFGILGPNGSGKTTTLGMLLGVVKKSGGAFNWFGKGEDFKIRRQIGAILEHPIFYSFLSAEQNLAVAAKIKDVAQPKTDALLEMVGLHQRRKDPFRTYSLGMKQRLAIAAALISDPEVLIFDEPTNGLDPQGIADIRDMILQISHMGKTIILASHLLDEVQKVCTDFIVLRSGEKIFEGSVDEVLRKRNKVEIGAENLDTLKRTLMDYQVISGIDQRNGVLIAQSEDDLNTGDLNRFLIERGIVVTHLVNVKSNLEEQFLAILREHAE